jgi:hypothetical protein
MPQRAPSIPQNYQPAAPSPWEFLTTPRIEFAPSPQLFQSVTGAIADTTANLANLNDSYGVGFASKYLIDPIAQSLNKAAIGEPISPFEAVELAAPFAGAAGRPLRQAAGFLAENNPGKFLSNIPNKVESALGNFYSGVPGAKEVGAANVFVQGAKDTAKQFFSPQSSTKAAVTGVSKGTERIIRDNLKVIDDTEALYAKTGSLSDEQTAAYKEAAKTLHGQLAYNALITKQAGGRGPVLQGYLDKVYHNTDEAFTKDNFVGMKEYATKAAKKVVSDEIMEGAYDIIANTWKTNKFQGSKPLSETGAHMVVKKHRVRSAGVHDRDAISSKAFNQVKEHLTAKAQSFDNTEDLLEYLRNIEDPKFKIAGANSEGVYVQFSPEAASGFVEGGTNAVVHIKPDRMMSLFVSDEHDLFGMVPTGYDRLVTVLPPWPMNFFGKGKALAKPEEVARARMNVKVRGRYDEKPKSTREPSATQKPRERLFSPYTRGQMESFREAAAPVDTDYFRWGVRRGAPVAGAGLLWEATDE